MRVGKVRVAVLAAVVVVFIGTISAAPAAVGPNPEAGEGGPMDGPDAGSNPVVPTDAGPVRGTTHADHRSFQAIPYAAPPVGDLRWRSPRRPVPWVEPRDATKPGAACPQVAIAVAEVGSREEDCLSLNVFVPRSAVPGSLHPVMVWIHGGGGANGAGSFFDPRRLTVDGDVVVVTVNYRLGIFGAFGLAGLEGSGGFGLEDQQAALRWVQRNIAAFGGDLENVTLFGESYGALATSAQLTSPAAGLFHRAAIQSGLALIDFPPNTLLPGQPALPSMWLPPPEIEELGAFVATELGCTDGGNALACLRALPVEDLLLHSSLFTRYAFGSDVLPEDPVAALRAGRFHPVPLISGATRDEARLFVATFYDLAGQAVTPEGYPALLAEAFGPAAERVAARYPLAAYESPSLAWAAVITDRVWALRTMEQNRSLADHVPTYAYEFADQSAPPIVPFPPGFPPGAYHSAEVAYQFDLESGGAPFSPEQRSLAEQMNRYWARFAATGDPNGDDLPRWERFDNAASVPHVQALAPGRDGIRPVDYASRHQLDFWAGLD
jgi:para-nitrobenzyl esterase